MIEHAERALRDVGVIGDLRVRYHGDLARVEVGAEALDTWLAPHARAAVHRALCDVGFSRVVVDLRGFRSGSLNVLGGVVAEPLVRARSSARTGDAAGLAAVLERSGLSVHVETRDRLALVGCASVAVANRIVMADVRSLVVEAARGQGFTHVALDLEIAGDDAAVRRD
jgi:PP-loop superfamily ATP-utilizing enzyme